MNCDRSNGGASISIGFILNMGIAVVFIALIFIVLQGALDRSTASTEAQLEEVGHEVSAMLISADKLANTTDQPGTAYFEPPETGLDSYTVKIETTASPKQGVIIVGSGQTTVEIPFRTLTNVDDTQFTSGNERVKVVYKDPTTCGSNRICIG